MSYTSVYNGVTSVQTFKNRAGKLGSDYDTLCALADRAAEWIRGQNKNTEGVRHLSEAIDGLPQTKRIKAMKYIRSYFGDIHNVTKNAEGNYTLKRERGSKKKKGKLLDFPEWESFDSYVKRKESEEKGPKEYDGVKKLSDMARSLRKKSDEAAEEGDHDAAKLFADMADDAEMKLETYKQKKSIAQRNAEREGLVKAAN